jgi:hypothetical protein
MIEEAKKQAAAGSIITLCWHMLRPTEDEPGKAGENGRPSLSWTGSVQARLTDEQWRGIKPAALKTPITIPISSTGGYAGMTNDE